MTLLTTFLLTLVLSTGCASSGGGAFPTTSREVTAQDSPAVGSHAAMEGSLEVLIEDSSQGSRTLYFLVAGERRVALRFSRSPNLLTGARIHVEGTWGATGELEVESFEVIAR
jgi:hypothetical protein